MLKHFFCAGCTTPSWIWSKFHVSFLHSAKEAESFQGTRWEVEDAVEVVDEVAVHGDQVVPAELEGLGVVVVELVGAGQALVVDGMDSAHRGLVQGDTGVSAVAV